MLGRQSEVQKRRQEYRNKKNLLSYGCLLHLAPTPLSKNHPCTFTTAFPIIPSNSRIPIVTEPL
jgi:hypothetical protein